MDIYIPLRNQTEIVSTNKRRKQVLWLPVVAYFLLNRYGFEQWHWHSNDSRRM